MAKLLCNFVLNRRRFILNESVCLKSVASFGGKLPAISGCGSSYRHHHNRSDHSNQQHNNRKINSKVFLWAAAPTFVAFFNKPEGADDETLSWFERLLPYKLRIFFQKVDDSPEGQLTMMIKRAIICIQENEVEKAEQMLHLALRMAQEMQHFDGITMCFDIMANLALEVEQYEKAEKLFVAVLQRLLQQGTEKNDLKVLHISLKIAQIAENLSQPEKAELGYQWVLEELEKLVKIDSSDPDLYGLWALANDYYGKFLMQTGNYTQARNHLTTSYNVYTHIHGTDDPVVVDMLNNLAAVCTNLEDYTAAEVYLIEALELAKKYPEFFETGIYHANMGMVYMNKGLLPQAQAFCAQARHLAKENNCADGLAQANYCMEQLKTVIG